MRKLLDPLLKDVLEQFQSPAVQEPLEELVLRPLLQRILNLLYPYLFGVMLLWIMMFLSLALILLILLRGSVLDTFSAFSVFRKQQ